MKVLERQFAQTVAEHKGTIYTVCYMFSQDADEVNDLFNVACIIYTYYNTKDIMRPSLMQEDLLEVRRKVARAKKLDSQWLLIGIPFIVLWISWFAYEAYKVNGMEGLMGFGIAALIGGTIGGIIGFRLHFKTQRQYQEIIDQTEELTEPA